MARKIIRSSDGEIRHTDRMTDTSREADMALTRDAIVTVRVDISRFLKAADRLSYTMQHIAGATTCPYCTRPQGWDACPIHHDHP